jgi:hypothetical protein
MTKSKPPRDRNPPRNTMRLLATAQLRDVVGGGDVGDAGIQKKWLPS